MLDSGGAHLSGGSLHGNDNPRIRPAPANITFERAADLGLARLRRLLEKPDAPQNHARSAVAALQSVSFQESFLHRMQFAVLRQTLNGRDFFAGHHRHARHAGSDGRAFDQDGARAALSLAAPVFGAGELEFVAENPEQQARRVDHQPVVLLVDHEFHAPILRLLLAARLSDIPQPAALWVDFWKLKERVGLDLRQTVEPSLDVDNVLDENPRVVGIGNAPAVSDRSKNDRAACQDDLQARAPTNGRAYFNA